MIEQPPSYCDIAINKIPTSQILLDNISKNESSDDLDDSMVNLSFEDRNCLYAPWQYSVIVKAFGS